MRKFISKLLAMAILAVSILNTTSIANDSTEHNYVDVLSKSILFYEANWCGEKGEINRLEWKGDCHTEDGADVGLDLSGGFHDAGDHVKFGLPQGYSASVLSWTLYEYEDTLKEKGEYKYLANICKHFTDYFIKCHPDPNTFYYQVGDGDEDHAYWGPPELQDKNRPTYAVATPDTPASEMCGDAAAALALMYINSKDSDEEYANVCLENAISIYTLGKTYLGRGTGQSYYTSGPYWDELTWAAIWLYRATGDDKYLEEAEGHIYSHMGSKGADGYQNNWTLCWDDVWAAVFLELYEITEKDVYKNKGELRLFFLSRVSKMKNLRGALKILMNMGDMGNIIFDIYGFIEDKKYWK